MDIAALRAKNPDHWMKAAAIRALTLDAVAAANSGHSGMPMGMADVATVLFEKHLKFDASAPNWPDRDRFILSAGHGSMLIYSLLHLTGYEDVTMEQIKNFRQWGAITAGHPEYGHAKGIETTTGPLGQGISNAVGFAMAEASLRGRYGKKIVDHYTYVIAGDGCLMEGVSQEAIALAGRQELSKLIVFWDNNNITIDGTVDIADRTNQVQRFKASGWHVQEIDGHDPEAIDAAIEARAMLNQAIEDKRLVLEMELQQARYDASLAERRYAACDPDNRLIASELEKRWDEALGRVRSFEQRLDADTAAAPEVDVTRLEGLAQDLETAWTAPATSMRDKQRLLRTLIEDIVADIDDDAGEIVLVVHWKGGRHTELRVKKPKSGEHNARTSEEALGIIREMAGRWPDESIAACLNRMGMPTGQGKTWNAKRVSSIRRVNDIHGYLSADKDGPWRTMTEAAKELGVTNHVIRRLIKDGILPANQVVDGAPYQIRTADLHSDKVKNALARKGRPCRADHEDQLSMFPSTYEGGA